MLGNLDNEVIFKKAFTDKFVLQCLVKDLFGVDFVPNKVETEKRFRPKIAHIDFRYDIFAQSKDERVVVEIQKVDYDYNFDRFLLYHNMAIAELQRSSQEYKATKIVYTIVVVTDKYIAKSRNGDLVQQDVLVHYSNLFTLDKEEIDVFGHKLIFLNYNHLKISTPNQYKDWLVLVQQSIKNPEFPNINFDNHGVKKVAQLIDYEQLTAEELTESKNRHAAESSKRIYEEMAEHKGRTMVAQNLKNMGIGIADIVKATGLSENEIKNL
jgi:predicted transposase/invertase (TIGR01784 family)